MLVACSEDDNEGFYGPSRPVALDGLLQYRWSINGRQVADDCADVGAVLFESVVLDEGYVVDGVTVACEDFEATLPLYRDDFLARSAITDVNGRPAVGRVIENLFEIDSDKVTTLVLDFPSAALPMDPGTEVPGADAGVVVPPAVPDAGTPDEPTPAPVDAGADAAAP
jgi:hypothetical protein